MKKRSSKTPKKNTPTLPPSPTNLFINFSGLALSIAALLLIRKYGKSLSDFQTTLVCLAAYAFPILALECLFLKTYALNSNGLDFRAKKADIDLGRVSIKLLGFYFTVSGVAGVYWIFPEYRGDFYAPYYALLRWLLPFLLISAIPYFFVIDRYMREPKDGYWQMGIFVLESGGPSIAGPSDSIYGPGW